MKGLKIVAFVAASLCASTLMAAQPADTAKESVLTPGARLIAGEMDKNEFYILGHNEPMPAQIVAKKKALEEAAQQKNMANQAKPKNPNPIDMRPTPVNQVTSTPIDQPQMMPPKTSSLKKAAVQKPLVKKVMNKKITTTRIMPSQHRYQKTPHVVKTAAVKKHKKLAKHKSHQSHQVHQHLRAATYHKKSPSKLRTL